MCFDFLYNFCLKHFSSQEELSEIWPIMYIGLQVKYPSFLSDFNETPVFSTDFRKTQISDFMKIHPMGAELFRADGQTDRQTLLLLFSRLYDVSTSSCAHFTIILYSSSSCLCHYEAYSHFSQFLWTRLKLDALPFTSCKWHCSTCTFVLSYPITKLISSHNPMPVHSTSYIISREHPFSHYLSLSISVFQVSAF